MEDFNHYHSHDFYICCLLLSMDFKLARVSREDGNFVEFYFRESPETCHEVIAAYWNSELRTDPKKLIEAINTLKTIIHSQN